ncbi:hypothetical protein TNCV_4188101 [Trichonephila clavipes]|nr:hypothetical protein TNCV_4188101 [Trichonephila clavipes]
MFQLSTDLTCIAAPTRRVFSGTGLELVTRQATIRYLYHSATAATSNNIHLTLSCIYKPPRNHINTTELDAILNASPKVMLFGDFNARHPCWNPGLPNTHGNTLYDWASAHALDIMAPTAPTYFAARGTCSILDIAFAKNLTLEDINSIKAVFGQC